LSTETTFLKNEVDSLKSENPNLDVLGKNWFYI
jgi:hypothetical protein